MSYKDKLFPRCQNVIESCRKLGQRSKSRRTRQIKRRAVSWDHTADDVSGKLHKYLLYWTEEFSRSLRMSLFAIIQALTNMMSIIFVHCIVFYVLVYIPKEDQRRDALSLDALIFIH